MNYQNIEISKLIVNPNNDRHGPTPSEASAIEWLFTHKAKEMKKIANRICEDGRVYDAPLVVEEATGFLVVDGNRRVTCLKLIHAPSKAPEKFRNFFSDLNKQHSGKISAEIVCQVEEDTDVADKIIELRHNGTQGGAGQLMWGTREKANHANRTSGTSDYEWPQLVEDYLIANGHADEAASIQRSTLERVLKAKKRRESLGLAKDEDGKLTSSIPGYDPTELFLRFASDIQSKKLTLKETLVARDIDSYLNRLRNEGIAPSITPKSQNTKSPTKTKAPKNTGSPRPSKQPQTRKRSSLIPQDIDYQFRWIDGQYKIDVVWKQLQFELEFSKHKFSISLVLRVLLEMVAKNYRDKMKLPDKKALAKNLTNVAIDLTEKEYLEGKVQQDVRRIIENSSSTISIENLQRIVHSNSQVPSEDDLRTMWDCLEPFLVTAIKAVQEQPHDQSP